MAVVNAHTAVQSAGVTRPPVIFGGAGRELSRKITKTGYIGERPLTD